MNDPVIDLHMLFVSELGRTGRGYLKPLRCHSVLSLSNRILQPRKTRPNVTRGVPAYTQSTQLRTLIFECPKKKNVLNREKCNKNMPLPD